jgi:hypothetical protein
MKQRKRRRRSHFLPLLLLNNAAAGNACFHDDSTAMKQTHSAQSEPLKTLAAAYRLAVVQSERAFVSLPEIQLALNLIQSDSPLLHHPPFFALFAPGLVFAQHKL